MAYKMKGFPMTEGSALHQNGKQRKLKKGKLLKSEMEGTHVYDPKEYGATGKEALQEKINDLEDRIEFIQEDIFSDQDGKATAKQNKDIAAMRKRIPELRTQKK